MLFKFLLFIRALEVTNCDLQFRTSTPNGAGRTTFAREYLLKEAHCPDFINVELIAAGLSSFNPDRAAIQAGRLMLSEISGRVRSGRALRFDAGLRNFQEVYMHLVDKWESYDNSGNTPPMISEAGKLR